MNEITLTKMKQMKLHGMHGAFKTAVETGKTDDYTLDEFVSMIVDAEWDDRKTRKIQRGIKNARFHYKASIEDVVYDQTRNIDKTKLLRLAACDFIDRCDNALITGSTGAGKSYIATALGYQACIEGYRVMYFNTTKLFSRLKMAKADGSYLKELANLAGIKKNITHHVGRHTFATQALNKGVSLEVVQKLLGHTDIKTTQIYAKMLTSTIVKEMEKMGRVRKD